MTELDWIVGPDTGTSSKAIWGVMNGVSVNSLRSGWGGDTPRDPDDFGRCYRLLKLFPDYSQRLGEVAKVLPWWGPMIREWAKLTEMYERVIVGDGWNRDESKAMYDVMCKLNEEGGRFY